MCVCVSLFVCALLSHPYGVMCWSMIVVVPAHSHSSFFVKMWVLCLSLFCCALLCALSIFAIILKRKRELVALHLLSYGCLVTVNVLWLFLTVPWVGLQCVIVVFPDHIHLHFNPG